jgi:hypothetical protein
LEKKTVAENCHAWKDGEKEGFYPPFPVLAGGKVDESRKNII